MKVGVENGRTYIETKDYNDFYMKAMPCKRFITLGEAIRLRKELDDAINATLTSVMRSDGEGSGKSSDLCPECGKLYCDHTIA